MPTALTLRTKSPGKRVWEPGKDEFRITLMSWLEVMLLCSNWCIFEREIKKNNHANYTTNNRYNEILKTRLCRLEFIFYLLNEVIHLSRELPRFALSPNYDSLLLFCKWKWCQLRRQQFHGMPVADLALILMNQKSTFSHSQFLDWFERFYFFCSLTQQASNIVWILFCFSYGVRKKAVSKTEKGLIYGENFRWSLSTSFLACQLGANHCITLIIAELIQRGTPRHNLKWTPKNASAVS